jgi:formylglycine-generating enzyme required for sulfatase activity
MCRHKVSGMVLAAVLVLVVFAMNAAMADTFGTGANQFTMEFVPISGATNPTSGIPGDFSVFTGVATDYRMGTYEVANDQWNKFQAAYGAVVGYPSEAYDQDFYDWGTGTTNVPANNVSWYEAAQFVNWLNTSTNHQAAYKFTGTQGTSNYTFAVWSPTDAGYDASHPYRNTAAKYFLPTENEWVKAGYWNGTTLQTYATKDNSVPTQGNGTSGTGWNYFDYHNNGYATNPRGSWNVGSGSEELNGTYDMMGNVLEWNENRWGDGRGQHGGDFFRPLYFLRASSDGFNSSAADESYMQGFRVASVVPEPSSIAMLAGIALTALLYGWRKRA